jgi:hypothetical protein
METVLGVDGRAWLVAEQRLFKPGCKHGEGILFKRSLAPGQPVQTSPSFPQKLTIFTVT